MPQFDASHFTSEVFWEVTIFLLFLLLLWRYVLPKINAVLDERSALIQGDIDSASSNKKESERLLAEYQQKLDRLHEEATDIMAQADKEIAEHQENSMRQLQEDIERKKQTFNTEIEFARRQAMKELKNISAEAAILAAEKLIKMKVDAETANRLVEDAIEKMDHCKDDSLINSTI